MGATLSNVVIIGGGPAGLAAAIYLARAGLVPYLFAGSPPGGQLMLTREVENFPGYESILGSELIDKMRAQAIKFGTTIIDENVQMVKFDQFDKLVQSIHTKTVLIATGAKALWLGVPGEEKLRGKGVSACATCDGFFFKNKVVAVVGGGDTALEEALTLTKFAKHVIIIHRKGEFRASKIMQKRVRENAKIEVVLNAKVEEILGEIKVEGIKLSITNNQRILNDHLKNENSLDIERLNIETIPLNGVFVAIGHKPDTDLFKGQVELDGKGYIVTTAVKALTNYQLSITNNQRILNDHLKNENSLDIERLDIGYYNTSYQSMTSTDGVFAAGDCVDTVYRQAATAAGMGVGAALDIERYLEKNSD